MSKDWKLIWKGLLLASLGSASAMLYIVGLSAAYLSRYATGVGLLVIGALFCVIFLRLLSPYLQQLLDREHEGESAHAARFVTGDKHSPPAQ